jgi:hypothetical protein
VVPIHPGPAVVLTLHVTVNKCAGTTCTRYSETDGQTETSNRIFRTDPECDSTDLTLVKMTLNARAPATHTTFARYKLVGVTSPHRHPVRWIIQLC